MFTLKPVSREPILEKRPRKSDMMMLFQLFNDRVLLCKKLYSTPTTYLAHPNLYESRSKRSKQFVLSFINIYRKKERVARCMLSQILYIYHSFSRSGACIMYCREIMQYFLSILASNGRAEVEQSVCVCVAL